jgi:thiamine-monophosphate kinase
LAHADPQWLEPFSQGLLALADAHGCELIGGDTTKGPLTISITVFGDVPPGQALLRSGARPGDDIYVSGTLGDAFLALQERRGTLQLAPVVRDMARGRMERPTPRVALGLALRAIASSAADISDGLLGDLGHILQRSAVGATIDTELAIQLLAAKSLYTGATAHFDTEIGDGLALQCVLSGGDDYELVFTAPPQARPAVQVASGHSGVGVTRIGTIEPQAGLRLVDGKGEAVENCFASFDHFL